MGYQQDLSRKSGVEMFHVIIDVSQVPVGATDATTAPREKKTTSKKDNTVMTGADSAGTKKSKAPRKEKKIIGSE